MNKKSLILAAILLGVFLTPQKTKTGPALVIASVLSVGSIAGLIFTGHSMYKPRYARDFLRRKHTITSYSSYLRIYTKKNKKNITVVDKKITSPDFKTLASQVEKSAEPYSKQKFTTLEIQPSLTLEKNNTSYQLKNIKYKNFSMKAVKKRLNKTFIVPNTYFTQNKSSLILSALLSLVGVAILNPVKAFFPLGLTLGIIFSKEKVPCAF